MQPFSYHNPKTLDDAVKLLTDNPNAAIMAGGTEILHTMKQNMLPKQPTALVNLKSIEGLSYVKEEGQTLKIGPTTKLVDISKNKTILGNYRALALAAAHVASPMIRNMGTIAGNLLQDVWCWYFRGSDNQFNCIRKGGAICYSQAGDNRYYNSIFGGPRGCYAVHSSDTAVALVALNASVMTTEKTIPIEQLFTELPPGHTLKRNEIVKEIQVPASPSGSKSAFMKVAIRDSIDFALASAAVWYTLSAGFVADARIVLGAVYLTPRRANAAEQYLKGKSINESTADEAGAAAVRDAVAMTQNAFRKQLAATMVKRALLA